MYLDVKKENQNHNRFILGFRKQFLIVNYKFLILWRKLFELNRMSSIINAFIAKKRKPKHISSYKAFTVSNNENITQFLTLICSYMKSKSFKKLKCTYMLKKKIKIIIDSY